MQICFTLAYPFKKEKLVSGKVLAKTTIELLKQDSTVYYWRTQFDQPISGESTDWSVSSFSYIKNGDEGWAQLRKDQTTENFFSGLVSDGEGKPFRFEETKTSLEIATFGINNPLPDTDVSVKINGSEYNLGTQNQPCRKE